jgi:CubicO group peptidase (beta-lactamase class C family)
MKDFWRWLIAFAALPCTNTLFAVSLLGLLAASSTHAAPLSPLHESALNQLLERGAPTKSDAIVIWQDGHELGHYYANGTAPGPIELMSVTKSIVALAIGPLLADGRIKSLDEPVADFYPEWRQGKKAKVTIRMIMNHTSGIQNVPRTDVEIYPAPDSIQLALAAELSNEPGDMPSYNNKAVNLLSGIIEKAAGKPMDVFLRDGLFKDMDIHPGPWGKDKAGHPYAMAGLPLTAADLGKFGELVLNKGNWHGKQLLPVKYIDALMQPQSEDSMGLLWWIAPQYRHFTTDPAAFAMLRKRNVPEPTVVALEKGLQGAHYDDEGSMMEGIRQALGPHWQAAFESDLIGRGIGPYRLFKVTTGPAAAYFGSGDGGQYLVVVPFAKIVAVRQINADSDSEQKGQDFEDFLDSVLAIAKDVAAQTADATR